MSEKNLKDILHQSILLNIDIFSDDFEDDHEDLGGEGDIELQSKVKVDKIKSEVEENIIGLDSIELEIDFDNQEFMLSIEDEIEKSDIYKVKKELDEYMKKNQSNKTIKQKQTIIKKQIKIKTLKQIKTKSPNLMKSEKKIKVIKKKMKSKLSINEGFNVNKSSEKKEVKKGVKNKDQLFNISDLHSKEVNYKKRDADKIKTKIPTYNNKNKFNMTLGKSEKMNLSIDMDNKLMDNGLDKKDKTYSKNKNNLKIEGV